MVEQKQAKSHVNLPMSPKISQDKNPELARVLKKSDWRKKRHVEAKLWEQYKSDPSDRNRNVLWVFYQPLVKFIACRLKTKLPECVDRCDMVSAGNIGLQKAIAKFNPEICVRFETFAVPRLRGAMLDAVRSQDWVPRLIRTRNHQFERVVEELSLRLKRAPTEEEIAFHLGISDDIFQAMKKELEVRTFIPTDDAASGAKSSHDSFRLEMVEDQRITHPSEKMEKEEIGRVAEKVLSAIENAVIKRYYYGGQSMKQIGEALKVSESRVCQIHAKALEILRRKLRAYGEEM
jgi:RNA polymerase sigma factor for flagellar operon FliA